jgi:spermidine/putrescine transport system ATP-binding protein
MAKVAVESVSKTYGGIRVVDDASLTVAQGEFVVLLGPSGCGKTTTLRMIAGFVDPDAGRIAIGEEDVTHMAPRLRNVGMVFQNYALFPNMTVAENIGFGLRQHRVPKATIATRVAELLALIQMPSRGNSPVNALSGGQQQRVALARALANSPRVLLMDEPLGALDLKLREAMQMELTRIQRELGVTTILVTHDQHEAMNLADRIVVMAQGRIQQIGTPDDLYIRPSTRFVAEFVGRNNFLAGLLEAVSGSEALVRLESGASVHVPVRANVPAGMRVELAVRPQHVTLGVASGIAGRVEERRFLGNVVHYAVRLPSNDTVLVEASTESTLAEPGTDTTLSWQQHHTYLFDMHGHSLHADNVPPLVLARSEAKTQSR